MFRIGTLVSQFSLPCLLLGVLLFAASLTPSLIPRGPAVQGILGGVLISLGYLFGRAADLIWRAADMPRLQGKLAASLNLALLGITVSVTVLTIWFHLDWQNELRQKMGLEPAEAQYLTTILVSALITFAIAFAMGILISGVFRWVRAAFYRIMPVRRANILGVITVILLLFVVTRDGLFDRAVTGLDESYEAAQKLFENAPPRPTAEHKAGSAASLMTTAPNVCSSWCFCVL